MKLPFYLERPGDYEAAYFQMPHNTIDLETTNLEKGSALVPGNRIVLAAVANGHSRVEVAEPLVDHVPQMGVFVAHNAKFEQAWMNRSGIDTTDWLWWDTMVAEYCLAGNRRWPLDLGSVAKRYGYPGKHPLIDSLMKGGVCPSQMPAHLLTARAIRDVETTRGIFLKQRERLRSEGLLAVMFTRCILIPVLAEIERTGLYLDAAKVDAETRKVLAELKASKARIDSLTGGLNPRSTKQVAQHVYGTLKFAELTDRRGNPLRNKATKTFPDGAPRVDTDTLDKLVATTDAQREFLKARAEFGVWNAKYTKTLGFLKHIVDNHKSLMYGRFNQTVTQTHRLSSSSRKVPMPDPETGKVEEKGIQLQNLPREYKSLFTVRDPDYVYVEVDGSQLEFRVAAFLGQDKTAAADIVSEADIHRFTASVLCRVPEDKVTKKQRTDAKPSTFKPLYGGQTGTKREVEYYEAFRAKYHEIEDTQKGWVADVLRDKELKTITGLKFYWPTTKITSSGYVENTPSIYNYPIQSLATADIIPISLTGLYWRCRMAGLRVLFTNTVHDSVAMEVHRDDVAALKELAYEAFLEGTYEYLDQVYGIQLNVPLGAAFTAGTHLGEGEEEKTSRPYVKTKQLVE